MTEETKKAPVMRFQGFSDDWEQRELGELATKIGSGKTPRGGSSVYTQSGIPLLRSQNIYDDKVSFEDVAFINDSTDEDMANSRVNRGDVLLNITGASIGRSAVYELSATANVNQHVCIIRPSSNVHSYFIQLNLASSEGQKQIELNQAGGGREGLNFQQIAKMSFYYPSLEEQIKLGVFFQQLNKTIALHQRKLTLLKQLKQTYLQALFPQSELNIPTLRFARFSDSWEHRKVSSLAKETFGGGTPKTGVKKYWKGSFPWIQSSDLTTNQLHNVQPTKFITEEAIKQSATHNVPGNSIAIVTRVGVGKLALMRSSYSTSQDFLSLSNLNVDAVFGVYCLYKMLQREVNNIQGTSIKGITKADLLGKCVSVPTKVEEQVKIGAFFKKIDDTIDFHESKLKHILELKKAFLEKMFL